MNLFTKIFKFFHLCITRYLLATELFIVEPWEKILIHIAVGIVFGYFWYFNWCALNYLGSIRTPTNWKQIV